MHAGVRIVVLFGALISSSARAQDRSIDVPVLAPPPVRHAANRLSEHTGMPVSAEGARRIRLVIAVRPMPKLGKQGYRIREAGEDVVISANADEGLANGTYTLLRNLMIAHTRDPFSRSWNIEEVPHFTYRAMQVAPYRFGGSYGFAVLSPDRWSFEEWQRYVDFMRLLNMNTLSLVSGRMYDPAYPHSEREKWRYDVWKQVMDYCHQLGMRFHWMSAPNLVSQQAFWDHPDLRAEGSAAFWYGTSLNWKRGRDVILENVGYTLRHFQGLDGLELIYSDGGAFSFDDDTTEPAEYISDATHSYLQLLRDTGNDARFVYWNWALDFWAKVLIPEEVVDAYPKYRTLQDDVLPLLPRGVAWLDTSMLTFIHTHWKSILARGNPPLREGLLIGKEAGFRPVIDFFWYMNPEFSLNMFPHPYIGRTIQEAHYARDEIGADGVMGYRLAPPLRFVNDYVFFRLASDPSLTEEQLVNEAAAMLTASTSDQETVAEAIRLVERFWRNGRSIEDLEAADGLLRGVLRSGTAPELEYLSNGVTFLVYIIRLAQPGLTPERRDELKRELYATVRSMYVFQGLVADIIWLPEAVRMFNQRVDWMVEEYTQFGTSPYPEVVDRTIYPRARSGPVTLEWPE